MRQLGYDELISYQGSALYTWGGPEHYKHFLPRILELHSQHQDSFYIQLDEVLVTLKHADWEQWPLEEQNAVKSFVSEDWKYQINEVLQPSYVGPWREFEGFMDFGELLELVEIGGQGMGLKNFVHHFYHEGNALLHVKPEEEALQRQRSFFSFVKKNNLVEALEGEFFKSEATEPEYAGYVSVVQQMVEQELRLNSAS